MKVLISGAGIGGLTLAAFLEQVEIDYEIIEKSPDSSREGYSLGIWDNGRDILAKLGLADVFDAEGQRIKWLVIKNGAGKELKRYNLRDFYRLYGSAYTHVDRKSLHSWLLSKVNKEKIIYSTTIESVEERRGGMRITFSDGDTRVYDVLVGADGVHSGVRNIVFEEKHLEEFTDWRAWYVWIDEAFEEEKTAIDFMEPNQFIAVFDDSDRTLAVLMAPVDHNTWDDEEGRIKRLTNLFSEQKELIPNILKDVDPSDITPTDIAVVKMKKWYKGTSVLLGDAAHAMEPFGGFGASMAMEDAYVLAGELLKYKKGEKDIKSALQYYQRIRQKRVKKAKRATQKMRWLTRRQSPLVEKMIEWLAPLIPESVFTAPFHKLLEEEI